MAQQKASQEPKIELFIKASTDCEGVGSCPFCQRLFMILWLKEANFTINTVNMNRAPEVLRALAPGAQLPLLVYNSEVKTDTNKIEEFLEATLSPPQYPKLACKNRESNTAGDDIFRKFSAYIKNPDPGSNEERSFLLSLMKLDKFLLTPHPEELDENPKITESKRLFLDGNKLTLADCNLLPKLNIIKVACKEYRGFDIPETLKGLTRYLHYAYEQEQFRCTCPNDSEILRVYHSMVKYM